MELILILRVLLRRWYLVILPVVIVGAVVVPDVLGDSPAVSGGYTTTVRYTAAQVLEAIPNRDGDYQDVWLASELTVNAFTEWVRTGRFAQEVAQVAQADGVRVEAGALHIAADNARSIGQVFVNWGDAGELMVIAQAVITVLETRSQAYFPQLGDVPARVVVLDVPQVAPAPVSLPNRFAPFIKLALAGLIGIGAAFLLDYLDPTLRTREDVESLGVHVVAGIPKK